MSLRFISKEWIGLFTCWLRLLILQTADARLHELDLDPLPPLPPPTQATLGTVASFRSPIGARGRWPGEAELFGDEAAARRGGALWRRAGDG